MREICMRQVFACALLVLAIAALADPALAAHRSESDPGLTTTLCSAWMFLPQVGLSADLIEQMRAQTGKKK
jgi:hypothetical protein